MLALHSNDGGRLTNIGADCSRLPEGLVWVDLRDPSPDEENAVEAMLGVQVPTRLEMAEIEESSRLYEEGGALVMTTTLIDGAARTRPSRTQVTFVLTERRLITVRYADPSPFRALTPNKPSSPSCTPRPPWSSWRSSKAWWSASPT